MQVTIHMMWQDDLLANQACALTASMVTLFSGSIVSIDFMRAFAILDILGPFFGNWSSGCSCKKWIIFLSLKGNWAKSKAYIITPMHQTSTLLAS